MTAPSQPTEPSAPASHGKERTPDTDATNKTSLHVARIAATVSILTTIVTGAVAVYLGTHRTDREQSTASPTDKLFVSIDPIEGGAIDFPYQALSGHVRGLRAGESVWTFSRFASAQDKNRAKRFYPNNGPCRVNFDEATWLCPDMTLGDPDATGTYEIWVTVVNDAQALEIVKKITCAGNASLAPSPTGSDGRPQFPLGCDTSVSDVFPPTQENVSAHITAQRNY
jgi:hypothetical protein